MVHISEYIRGVSDILLNSNSERSGYKKKILVVVYKGLWRTRQKLAGLFHSLHAFSVHSLRVRTRTWFILIIRYTYDSSRGSLFYHFQIDRPGAGRIDGRTTGVRQHYFGGHEHHWVLLVVEVIVAVLRRARDRR